MKYKKDMNFNIYLYGTDNVAVSARIISSSVDPQINAKKRALWRST